MNQFNSNHPLPNLDRSWHSLSLDEILEEFQTDCYLGLTDSQVQQRSTYYGRNELKENNLRNNWEIFADQFKNVMLLLLIGVAIVSGILDLLALQNTVGKIELPFKDTIAILAIVLLNGILGFVQESKAEKALSALKRLSSPQVRVLRDGKKLAIDSSTLVPGDIIFVETGVQLAADGRILEAINLEIREAALTGEANPVNKDALREGLAEDIPLAERINMVFSGTEVVKGRGTILITNTGMQTELGKIARLLQGVQSDSTPLQKRMHYLSNILVSTALILVALVIVLGLIIGGPDGLQELVEVGLSMAVAVVPEGLPAVITVTLAIGTQRMVKRKALIRRLPAVETLGSVDTICSDKTGTLTQNKMVVREVQTMGGAFTITGEGYQPNGEFFERASLSNSRNYPQPIQTSQYAELQALLVGCLVCNDAIVVETQETQWQIIGDPTEGSLIVLATKAGLDARTINEQFPRIGEFPFSSERKRMSVICENSQLLLFAKGSPEFMIKFCDRYQKGDITFPLKEQQKQQILELNSQMASRGLRVLGFAYKNLEELDDLATETSIESDSIWLGLVGIVDPPRVEAKAAISKCKHAGIRTVMITGDHQLTAKAIAIDLGIATAEDLVVTGQDLDNLTQEELEIEAKRIKVYARVSPEHKLRIVRALQKQGRFVAMTGDGVNDAPALKQADIGISMGIAGTDVSKEASDAVLLDDNFATIVAATEEGRVVYSNIRRFIKYILGSNLGEVIIIGSAPLLGLGDVPLAPLQILWMNLVTDGLPALALALEPAEPNVMRSRPFSPRESIFARGLGYYIVRIGLVFSIIGIALMTFAYNRYHSSADPNSWKTMVFTTLCLAQMGHALAVRSHHRSILQLNFFSNPYLLLAVGITTILQIMLIYLEPLRNFFDTQILTSEQLLVCMGFSALLFVWVELEKLLFKYLKRKVNN